MLYSEVMGDDPPVFSVILPTRNRKRMLRRAVTGVRRQTYENFELLVIDDASEDDTLDATDLEDSRIRLFRNEAQLGAAGSRNIGIAAARGEYISFLDDDDELMTSFLSTTLKCLRHARPDVGLSWCGVKHLYYPRRSGDGHQVQLASFTAGPRDPASSLDDLICIGTGYGVTVKADCLRKVGGFDASLKTVEDIELFLRIVEAGFSAVAVPGVHVVVHNHTMPRLTDPSLHRLRIHEIQWLLSKYATLLQTHPRARAKLLDYMRLLQIEIENPCAETASVHTPRPGRQACG